MRSNTSPLPGVILFLVCWFVGLFVCLFDVFSCYILLLLITWLASFRFVSLCVCVCVCVNRCVCVCVCVIFQQMIIAVWDTNRIVKVVIAPCNKQFSAQG